MDRAFRCVVALTLLSAAASCGSDEVDSEEAAREAYLGIDAAIEKSLRLGMDGYNAATSANIPAQTTMGDRSGTLTVSGQVDAGVSPNKEMRLRIGLVDYSDAPDDAEVVVVYDTSTDATMQPALTLSLRDIPDGTFTGTLLGDFQMMGDLEGTVTLNLTLTGDLEADPMDTTKLRRVVGSTMVTGTATSSYGTYDVNVTL